MQRLTRQQAIRQTLCPQGVHKVPGKPEGRGRRDGGGLQHLLHHLLAGVKVLPRHLIGDLACFHKIRKVLQASPGRLPKAQDMGNTIPKMQVSGFLKVGPTRRAHLGFACDRWHQAAGQGDLVQARVISQPLREHGHGAPYLTAPQGFATGWACPGQARKPRR